MRTGEAPESHRRDRRHRACGGQHLARRGLLVEVPHIDEVVGQAVPFELRLGEDRLLFKRAMQEAGIDVLSSGLARSFDEALAIAKPFGFPVVVRPSFTLGGSGGGIASPS